MPEATGVQGRWDTWDLGVPWEPGDPETRGLWSWRARVDQRPGSTEEGSLARWEPAWLGRTRPRPRSHGEGLSLAGLSRPRARDAGGGSLNLFPIQFPCRFSLVCASPGAVIPHLAPVALSGCIFWHGWFLGERRGGMVSTRNFYDCQFADFRINNITQ